MHSAATIRLPGGPFQEGRRRSDAVIRQLTGADEAFLAETGAGLTTAARTTELLACVVERIGDATPSRDDLAGLTAGDREALLLHVLRLTFGSSLDCTLGCVRCGELLDVRLDVDELVLAPYEIWEPVYDVSLGADPRPARVTFRLPSGADQEAIAALASRSLETAVGALVRRCLIDEAGAADLAVDDELAAVIADRMASLDPQAVIELVTVCPECDVRIEAQVDALELLCRKVAAHHGQLIVDIDLLARSYHWSEDAILGLPVGRRRAYAAVARAGGQA
ncbi:MAG: hypothetical protein ACR2LK_05755 [Solirubrobacteraceae bacterium]